MDSSEVDDKLNDDILKVVEDNKAIESDDFEQIFGNSRCVHILQVNFTSYTFI